MPGIACVGSDSAGGTQLGGGQGFVRATGDIAVIEGDPVAGHGRGTHAAPAMAEGSSFVRISGVPVCRAGHLATCGHPSTGSDFVFPED